MELLVVIGIIAVLIAILLPTLNKARESANRAKCLSNVRQLAIAITAYVSTNKQFLPEACSANAALESPLSPRTLSKPVWEPVGAGHVLPSIGGLLSPYVGKDGKVWRCPSAPPESFVMAGSDPFLGHELPNDFRPDYNYVAGKEFYQIASLLPNSPLIVQMKLKEWAVRNVSGLRATRAVPRGQTSSQVVTLHDRYSTNHSAHRRDIYRWPHNEEYYASFAYLDGHAEGKTYRNVDEYLDTIHKPIRQAWYGTNFVAVFPALYVGH